MIQKLKCSLSIFRRWWLWLLLGLFLLLLGEIIFVQRSESNVMHPALDKLAALKLSERWSHPEMIKIRALGTKAVPPLRAVLREKDQPTTRFLLWLKVKWPGVTKIYRRIPDVNKLTERRWTACQVLQTLGPAGKAAVPELINVLASSDPRDVNAGSMALRAVGIDADVCESLDAVLESGTSGFGRSQIVMALGSVKPPSDRTLKTLTRALTDTDPYVPYHAADTLGHLGVPSPTVISGLKSLISTSTDDLTTLTASAALWQLEKDSRSVTGRVFQILEKELRLPLPPSMVGGNQGQQVDATEQLFMRSADLFSQMNLDEPMKARALALLESFCKKSDRIFIRMLLLPSMVELGLSRNQCIEVFRTGLRQEEGYYRIQAARLLMSVGSKHSLDGVDLDALLQDKDVGVRVYSAIAHWQVNKHPAVVVPVLAEALDRNKHQSYYYSEVLPAALKALGEVGAEAHGAAEAVIALTHDPNPTIANLATNVLAKIQK